MREPAADRIVQVPRRLQRPCGARCRRAGKGSRRDLLGQPCAGGRRGGPPFRRQGDDRHAGRRSGDQACADQTERRAHRRL